MIVLGLTGSIGMGKSTAAAMLRRLGLPVHDSDAAVHRLLGPGGRAVAEVGALFPEALRDDRIDRQALGRIVFADRVALRQLERILHPLVRAAERRFLAAHRRARRRMVVLDIPLLYETGAEARCDAVIVVSAPRRVQLGRVLPRAGMSREKLAAIERRQTSDGEKRRRADYLVRTGLGKRATLTRIAAILRAVKRKGA
jgi:dephospho-CoA kinase